MAYDLPPLTAAHMKYLLVLSELDDDEGGVRCTDVAELLHVTKPSVHRMMALLREMQLIHKDRYGAVFFTESGRTISLRYARCFGVLCTHFSQLLCDNLQAKSAACAVLAQLPLEAVEQMCARMEPCPGAME